MHSCVCGWKPLLDSELVNWVSETCSSNPLTNIIDAYLGWVCVCPSVLMCVCVCVHAGPAGSCVLVKNPVTQSSVVRDVKPLQVCRVCVRE